MTYSSQLSADTQALMRFQANKKSTAAAYVLWYFLGWLGAHRFYLGRTGSAVVLLLVGIAGWVAMGAIMVSTTWGPAGIAFLAPLGVWLVVDLFLIPGIARQANNRLMAELGGGPVGDRTP